MSTPTQDDLKAASEAVTKAAIRAAFELGWCLRDQGVSLSDALARYDEAMAA